MYQIGWVTFVFERDVFLNVEMLLYILKRMKLACLNSLKKEKKKQ
jgi:hypothetical protein